MIFCDFGPDGQPVRFDKIQELIVARHGYEVRPALARADVLRKQGYWIAGYISYEAGLAFEQRLMPLIHEDDQPLLVLGAYDAPLQPLPNTSSSVNLSELKPLISKDEYFTAFHHAQDYIASGDCYQINLTFPIQTQLINGTPSDLATALAELQPVDYAAYLDLGVGPIVISRSPELFFSLTSDGRIEARPMKGTAPRAVAPAEDAALAAALAASPKNRAENLMIVDLLRNDISALARVGSVQVPDLFTVESFSTVHQMTSRITAELTAPAKLETLMPALFPCGSITGAPKIRAMQIIHELERHPRGVYCGAIGWMAPDGAAAFSVAIRTLTVQDNLVRLNVGGGIVADSTAEDEWEEALWKARFIQPLTTANSD